MKKLIIIVALIGFLLTPTLSKAATAEELQAQTNVLIQQLIQMLVQRIAELQQQIVDILANQQIMIQAQIQPNVGTPALAPQEPQPTTTESIVAPIQQVQAPILTFLLPPAPATLTVSSFLSSGTFDIGTNQVLARVTLQTVGGSVSVKRIAFSTNDSNVQFDNLFLTQDYYKDWSGNGVLVTNNMVNPKSPVFVLSSPFVVNFNSPINLYLKGDVISGGTMNPFGVNQDGVTAVDAKTGDMVNITYLGSQ